MNALRLFILAITPGVIAYMVGYLIVSWPGGSDLFSQMAADRVPHALAILATQIWLTGAGLALIVLAGMSAVKEWRA